MSSAVSFATTVRAADDGRVVFNAREERTIRAGAAVRTEAYRGTLALKDFAPGSYVLRVEATSGTGNQFAFREVPFEVRSAS